MGFQSLTGGWSAGVVFPVDVLEEDWSGPATSLLHFRDTSTLYGLKT